MRVGRANLRMLLLCVCLGAAPCMWAATGQSGGGDQTAALKATVALALEQARKGEHYQAIKLLSKVLGARPELVKVRLLRAKLYIKTADLDAAAADLTMVAQSGKDTGEARSLLARVQAKQQELAKLKKGGPRTYSAWERMWTIPGAKPLTLTDFAGGEGYTLFYFPEQPVDQNTLETYRHDSVDQELYFLRVVDLKGADGRADLTLPAATSQSVDRVPFLIMLDSTGKVIKRGGLPALTSTLKRVREEARDKKVAKATAGGGSADGVSKVDFSQAQEGLESLAQSGYTTVVMVTSPG